MELTINKNLPLITSGVYIVYKHTTSLVAVEDKTNQTTTFWDYFQFKSMLFNTFPEEKITNICNLINQFTKLLIDFTKGKVYKVEGLEKDYLKTIWSSKCSVDQIADSIREEQFQVFEDQEDINVKILQKYNIDIEEV